MTISELKLSLIQSISVTDDQKILDRIKDILSSSNAIKTSDELKNELKKGIEELEKGEFESHQSANAEIEKWLNE
jgi:uncharacterized protein YpbB